MSFRNCFYLRAAIRRTELDDVGIIRLAVLGKVRVTNLYYDDVQADRKEAEE